MENYHLKIKCVCVCVCGTLIESTYISENESNESIREMHLSSVKTLNEEIIIILIDVGKGIWFTINTYTDRTHSVHFKLCVSEIHFLEQA